MLGKKTVASSNTCCRFELKSVRVCNIVLSGRLLSFVEGLLVAEPRSFDGLKFRLDLTVIAR